MRSANHYIDEAQAIAERGIDGDNLDHNHRMRLLAYAQVMATLAVASATDDVADGSRL